MMDGKKNTTKDNMKKPTETKLRSNDIDHTIDLPTDLNKTMDWEKFGKLLNEFIDEYLDLTIVSEKIEKYYNPFDEPFPRDE